MNELEKDVIEIKTEQKIMKEDYIEMKNDIKKLTEVQMQTINSLNETNNQLNLLSINIAENKETTKELTYFMKQQLNKPNVFVDKFKWLFIGGGVSFLWSYISNKLK